MIRYVRSFPVEGLALNSTSRRSPSETHEFHLDSVVFESDHIPSLSSATTIEPSLLNQPHIEDLLHDPHIIDNPVASTIMSHRAEERL